MRRGRPQRRYRKIILPVLAAVLVLAGVLCLLRAWELRHYQTDRDASNDREDSGQSQIFYRDQWYAPKENLESILFIGLDEYEKSQTVAGYTNTQQADFLLLLVIDTEAKTYSALHLNRDTMTQIPVLGVGGKPAGNMQGQLALAHTYGSGGSDSSRNTVKAVSGLLYGVKIDHYVSLTMDAVATINDAVGGVTLTVQGDFSAVDQSLIQGRTVTLSGDQALTYVRTRKGMEDSSNLSRMERQRQYLSALKKQWDQRLKSDDGLLLDVLLRISSSLVSDCTVERLSDMVETLQEYNFAGFLQTEGSAEVGAEFMEYHVDADSLKQTVISLFYEPLE